VRGDATIPTDVIGYKTALKIDPVLEA